MSLPRLDIEMQRKRKLRSALIRIDTKLGYIDKCSEEELIRKLTAIQEIAESALKK